jgi:predicted molibdopterin-dependent oxidoreductase YjgC
MVETEGTLTSGERRVQKVAKVFEPRCTMEGWQVLSALIRKGEAPGGEGGVFDLWDEIKKAVPQLSALDPSALEAKPFYWSFNGSGDKGRELYNGKFRTGSGKARLVKVELAAGPAAAAPGAYLVYQQSYLDLKSRLQG